MTTDVMEPVELTETQRLELARIESAQWRRIGSPTEGAYGFVTEDGEALVLLMRRWFCSDDEQDVYVDDRSDRTFVGFTAAKKHSLRYLRAEIGVPALGGV